jgi:cellulose synthase/poly-beta-1,6-N-acetylglucosamine synthase-like glycosyltransferase
MASLIKICVWLIWSYCAFFSLWLFLFAIAGRLRSRDCFAPADRNRKIAVLIPAYKEDLVIIACVQSLLQQTYPADQYDVIIIADSLRGETIAQLKKWPVQIVVVQLLERTKAKAINWALHVLPDHLYEGVVILDADNLPATDFLEQMNQALAAGCCIVQGHRVAKNQNTALAILDAISEEINNHIFRQGHRALGLSAALIGSGMGFEYDYHKQLMAGVTAVGGFDKEIELKALKAGITIHYLPKALIYDEKVEDAQGFTRQRKRWLAAQWHYFRLYFLDALHDLICDGNVDYLNKALQMIMPPRILLLGVLLIMSLYFALIANLAYGLAWLAILLLCGAALLISIPFSFYNRRLWRAAASLPRGFALMVWALLNSKGANKRFLHTQHKHTDLASHEAPSAERKNM